MGYVRRIFQSLTIPPAVRTEAITRGKQEGYGDALILERLENDGWLKTGKLSSRSLKLAGELADDVGHGEAEAIALAVEKNLRLLIDDEKGRRIAHAYGIETETTLGLLLELLAEGVLSMSDYRKNIKNYSAGGWITAEVMQEFLDRGEELE